MSDELNGKRSCGNDQNTRALSPEEYTAYMQRPENRKAWRNRDRGFLLLMHAHRPVSIELLREWVCIPANPWEALKKRLGLSWKLRRISKA